MDAQTRLGWVELYQEIGNAGIVSDPCMGFLKSIADVYACWYFSVLL